MMKHFCQINQVFDDNENTISCDYYNTDKLNKLNINRHHHLFILHLNISSLSSHIDDLKIFLSLLTAKVDISCISENILSQNNPVTMNLDIPIYTFEDTPIESSAGGTLIYISNDISYVLRNDFQIYSPKELESIFIEIIIPNKPSSILGTIYKHPSMKPYKFNNEFVEPFLSKIKAEGKVTFLAGDFNFNLIK